MGRESQACRVARFSVGPRCFGIRSDVDVWRPLAQARGGCAGCCLGNVGSIAVHLNYNLVNTMSLPQRIVLGIGVLVIVGMVLFPPWIFVYHYEPVVRRLGSYEQHIERPAGYHAIWAAHVRSDCFGQPILDR